MEKHTRIQWLTVLCVCAIGALFFVQAKLALRPVPISFGPMQVAYGYSNVTFSGTVYTDEGITTMGTGRIVTLAVTGAKVGSGTTNNSGAYSISNLSISANNVVTVYIDKATEKGVLVAKFNDAELSDQSVTGMNIYQNRLIVRTKTTDLNITTNNLSTAAGVNDVDVNSIYSVAGTTLTMGKDTQMYVWPSVTHTASGAIRAHDIKVFGTLNMKSNTLFASGSLVSTGTLTQMGDVVLQAVSSGETLTVTGSSLGNLYFDNGLTAHFQFDEGTGPNASGSTLNSATGGTLTNGAQWTSANTGTTLFFNPKAIELDGVNDSVTFGNNYNIFSRASRTFTGWFRRKSSTTEDTILAKRSGTGASQTGYALFIDDADDKLHFEVSDGTNEYDVASQTTFTDANWHQFAVTWDTLAQSGAQMVIDGTSQLEARTGVFSAVGAITGTTNFIVGNNAGSTSPFEGTVDDIRIYSRVLTGSEISFLSRGNKDTGSGKYTLGSRLTMTGSLGIYAGRLSVNATKNYRVNLAGDLSVYGTLLTQSGFVALNGNNQVVRGSTAFRNLVKSVTSTKTITFQSNTQQTFSGSLSLFGAVSNEMNIRATRTGSQSYLVLDESGRQTLKYLNVKDNNAMSGTTLVCTEGCVDEGNDYNWIFQGVCGDGVKNTGEACDDGNTANTDGCLNTCALAVCGDSYVRSGVEECDPPNQGACLANCFYKGGGGAGGTSSESSTKSYYKRPDPPDGCGNAILDLDKNEECDLGRHNGLGTCSYDCKKLYCGDGVISPQIGEDCEPDKQESQDGGAVTYTVPTCGLICTAPQLSSTQRTPVGGCKRVFLPECGSDGGDLHGSAPMCGNGIVEDGEECDSGGVCVGGDFDGSLWTDEVSAKSCMDSGGTPTPSSGDGCDDACRNEFCGDGAVQPNGKDQVSDSTDDEQCDNGSICENDASTSCRSDSDCGEGTACVYHASKDAACSQSCRLSVCGNGTVEGGERCDDGNADGGDGCSARCRIEAVVVPSVCGDGALQDGESCDDGNVQDGDGCSAGCSTEHAAAPILPVCGNGVLEEKETCDDGNSATGDGCDASCRIEPRCGDASLQSGEQCDNGRGNSDLVPDACRSDCRKARCGDHIADSGEQCDGGNNCTSSCTVIPAPRFAVCGDRLMEGNEQCDDGNHSNGDGCSATCMKELPPAPVCGNGKLESGEECDDQNKTSGDGCSERCTKEIVKPPLVAVETLDADVVIVNPTEIANALKFVENTNPCALMVRKGKELDAGVIRALATKQGIPIVTDVRLAHSLFDSIPEKTYVTGVLCENINILKKPPLKEPEVPRATVQKTPVAPTTTAYGYYNYATLTPIIAGKAPEGKTGPEVLVIAIAGAAGGMSWARRKKKQEWYPGQGSNL